MKPTFALKDNHPVHISEVERGLKCGCICSACKHPLQARKGEKRQHYFAHQKGSECSVETVIHHTAKQIIMDAGEIHVPATTYRYERIIDFYEPGQVIPLSNIHEEQYMGDIKPDIIGYYKGKPILIEIYVTHKVDGDKVQKIKDKSLRAIEIDLSKIGYDTDLKKLKHLVLYESTNREWINNERVNALHKRLLNLREYKPVFQCTWSGTVKILVYDSLESSPNSEVMAEDKEHRKKVMTFVFDCPIERRMIEGQSYAKFTDCRDCKYRYGESYPNGCVVCVGNVKSLQRS